MRFHLGAAGATAQSMLGNRRGAWLSPDWDEFLDWLDPEDPWLEYILLLNLELDEPSDLLLFILPELEAEDKEEWLWWLLLPEEDTEPLLVY